MSKGGNHMRMESERALIAEYGRKMSAAGLSHGTAGNISIYDKQTGLMAITPSGVNYFDITPEDIIGTKRNSKVVYPRQIAMYLCRELANIPLKSIGQCMGNRDHTTIMHGCDKIEQELQNSQTTQKAIEILKKKLQPGN